MHSFVKKLRMENPNNLFSLVTAAHASASGRAPPPAQLVAGIILSYRREERYFIPPFAHPCSPALGHCNFVWLGKVSCGLGCRGKNKTFSSAVVEKALSLG